MRADKDNLIVKSGTSIGANVREAQNAESKSDFIHKMKIAAKEADETEYWLTLCELSQNYPKNISLKEKIKPIIKILSKILSSSKSETNSINDGNLQISKSPNLQI